MKIIAHLILSTFLFTIINHPVLGQKNKDIELSNLIGKRFFENTLNNWLEKNSYKTAVEVMRPEGPEILIKNYERGYSLTFDINMVLNSISLFSKGQSFSTFNGKLPLNLKFGMNRDSLYKIIDLRLDEVVNNPFVLKRTWNNQNLELIFNSKGLNQINITANTKLPEVDDLGFVRLVSSGKIVEGDCDSLIGKMSWDNESAIYEGEWKYGMPHGKGYFKDQNNNWYKGDFKYGFFWGKGQLSVAGLYQYEGEFVMSRRNGTGSCKFLAPYGEGYEGQWRQDKMNGLGKYWKSSKHYYYGNMENDKFNGKGKLATPEGWIEGTFKDGLPNGIMKQFVKQENTMIEGQWINGKREGKFKLTNTETKKETIKTFKNDIEIVE